MQGVKLNSSILKRGKLVYFQNLVDLYLTQAYNAIPALSMIHANDKCVGVNHGTFEGTVSNLLGTTQKVTNSSPNVIEIANERV